MTEQYNSDEDQHLVSALTRLLRPLIRYLLARGFTYIRLIQIIRPLFVRLAEEQYGSSKKLLTDSRISVLTGLARRYVKELRQSPDPDPSVLKSSPSVKLVAEWVTNPRFIDKRGLPLQLHRLSANGNPSFEQLAAIASNDVRSRTLLDDLFEKGMIREAPDDKLELLTSAYKPDKNINELIDYFGQHIHDHMAAATSNLQPKEPTYFDRSAFQDGLSEKSLQALQKHADQCAMDMLKSVYAKASELAVKDTKEADSIHRFRMGVYCYSEEESIEDTNENPEK